MELRELVVRRCKAYPCAAGLSLRLPTRISNPRQRKLLFFRNILSPVTVVVPAGSDDVNQIGLRDVIHFICHDKSGDLRFYAATFCTQGVQRVLALPAVPFTRASSVLFPCRRHVSPDRTRTRAALVD